jgi:paired amphipathic helix protein Sin3a
MAYILSRLYQILYERIRSAKANAQLAGKKKSSDGGAAPNLYSRFMQVLYGLLDGSLDNSKFEDECRDIIGTQSYVLFTLDKLIFMLVKQLQAAAADEGVQKLLALNAYEYEREAVDLVYYADACVVLHDENLYRFENKSNSTVLLIQLMENSEKLDFPGNALGSPFQKYLDEFTKSAPTRTNQIIRRILKRKYAGEEQDVVIERALVNTKVVNGLENKISCRTFKVSYVLDTEDLFLRCTPRRSHIYKQERELKNKQIFGDWLDKARRKLSDSASESSISR